VVSVQSFSGEILMKTEPFNTQSIFHEKGITLIELLVALLIFGAMIGAIYRVFSTQARAYTVQDQVVEVQQDIRGAMELMVRDLRMAGFQTESFNSPLISNAPVVTPLQDNTITVNYEYIAGGPPMINQVTYGLQAGAGGTLNLVYSLTQIPPVGPQVQFTDPMILQNVTGLTFTYGIDQDHDGNQDDLNNDNQIDARDFLSAAAVNALGARIVAVRVDLTAIPDQTNQDVKNWVSPRQLTSSVFMRNMSFTASQAY
jgi:prepilin-type N-terminal cleavage/methylation domain-containing protein